MKTLLSYLVAFALALATSVLFKDIPSSYVVFRNVTMWLSELMSYIFLPVVFITFASGVASLVKDRQGAKTILPVLLWTLLTTIILSVMGSLFFMAYPISIPNSSTAGVSSSQVNAIVNAYTGYARSSLEPNSVIATLSYAMDFIFPVVIIAWIFGLALKPSSDVIRPSYQVMNSLSEVMYRVSKFTLVFGSFFVYFSSISFFLDIYEEKTALISPKFLISLVLFSSIAFFLIIPLIYALFTGFKKNPYSVMFRSASSYITGLTSSNIMASSLISMSLMRTNCGVQKRVVSVTVPLLSIFARGGTAFVSTITTLEVIHAVGGEINFKVALAIAFAVALISFISSIAFKNETFICSVLALRLVGINLLGREGVLIGLLTLVNGIAIAIDTYLVNLGTNAASSWVQTSVSVPIKDTI